jgi:hypothetical protein
LAATGGQAPLHLVASSDAYENERKVEVTKKMQKIFHDEHVLDVAAVQREFGRLLAEPKAGAAAAKA